MDIEKITKHFPNDGENINDPRIIKKIQSYLPVPNDMVILWAEINSFGGKPVGIVLTDRGIICKSLIRKKRKKESIYQFIPWEYYDPENYQVRPLDNGYGLYLEKELVAIFYSDSLTAFFDTLLKEQTSQNIIDVAIAEELTIRDLESVAFHAAYGADNSKTGHGIYAEEAGARLDMLHGEKVAVVGRDNAKNGPDKIVNQIPVQCKYYKTAGGSVGACFERNPNTGKMSYRYFQLDGKTPMMVEVPKDQYEQAVKLFEKRILNGEVPGIADPEAAYIIVRKGKLTYKQAVNLAKAGTIESLAYDITTGIISCTAIGGISAIAVFSVTYWQTKDKKKAANASLQAGLEVFGPAFAGRIIAQQLARTALPNVLIPLSTAISKMLNPQVVQYIVNSFRAMAQKPNIYGAAAQKSFAKVLRTNALTQVIIFGVTSIPDTYRVIQGKITGAQYTKNLTAGVAGLVGGAGGAVVGANIGNNFPGGIGPKALGIVGCAAGGFILGCVTRGIGALIKEDDRYIYSRMINSVICIMAIDYFLSEDEVKELIKLLDKDEKKLKKLMQELIKSKHQYNQIEDFMKKYFEEVVSKRARINQEKELEMCKMMDETIIDMSKEEYADEL